MSTLAAQVGIALEAQRLMLATAESCTGGGVAQAITEISGSSEWFERGFVTYSNESKCELLGVSPETISEHGAVSEAVAREMVIGALKHSHAQVALAVTGIAGPTGGTPQKPVGTVWFAWAMRDGEVHARLHLLPGNRAAVRAESVRIALHGVLELCAGLSATA